jgi:NAD(P)-dependent dehydrogenase (short-subunit alcohol dehydrogenase family)
MTGLPRNRPSGQFLQQIINTIPLGRTGTPEEAAQLIACRVSPAASFVPGAQTEVVRD